MWEGNKKFTISFLGAVNPAIMWLQRRETMVAKCELGH